MGQLWYRKKIRSRLLLMILGTSTHNYIIGYNLLTIQQKVSFKFVRACKQANIKTGNYVFNFFSVLLFLYHPFLFIEKNECQTIFFIIICICFPSLQKVELL